MNPSTITPATQATIDQLSSAGWNVVLDSVRATRGGRRRFRATAKAVSRLTIGCFATSYSDAVRNLAKECEIAPSGRK